MIPSKSSELREYKLQLITLKHYLIWKKLGIETAENWYSHIPKPITEHEDITLMESRDTNG
jgi:hypothetical protein